MPFCNSLFYTQCCDVNQPLHPLVCAIPTLGEASGSGPGHRFLLQSFPRRRLGQGSSWTQHVAAPCLASIPQVTPLPLSAPRPMLFLGLHAQALLVQRSERLEDTHQCHQLLLVQSICLSTMAGKIITKDTYLSLWCEAFTLRKVNFRENSCKGTHNLNL